jgi:hypothetical protein
VLAERFPETEDRVATKNLDDAATVQFEQGGAVVGTADEGAEEVHEQKGEREETRMWRCRERSGLRRGGGRPEERAES